MQSILGEAAGPLAASQWHGLLCGLLTAGRPVSAQLWHRTAAEFSEDAIELDATRVTELDDCIGELRRQLTDTQMTFILQVPEDGAPMSLRAEALGEWCSAFLFGLSAGGVDQNVELGTDSRELLQDIGEISAVSFDREEAGIDDELQFNELLEYIRVGVLLLNAELNTNVFEQRQEH